MNEQLAYPPKQAAKMIGKSVSTLYTWRENGLINFTKVGGSVFIKHEELQRVLDEGMENNVKPKQEQEDEDISPRLYLHGKA